MQRNVMEPSIDTRERGRTGLSAIPAATVPFVDLQLANRQVARDVEKRIHEVIDGGSFVLGPQVEQFEQDYADFCSVAHCIGVGNGTDAIELALRATGLGEGDDVIIPANTFVATAEGVRRCGANVVLADCDEDFLIDLGSVCQQINVRTRAVVAVDLYGQPAMFDDLRAALPERIDIIEDAAQSQGASRLGQPAGSFGSAAATSFYPGKNLGAFGDAGAVLTNSEEIAGRVRALRNHGGVQRYQHAVIGTNSRLDSMQAAVLSVKLRKLREWNAERAAAAQRYDELLGDISGLVRPRVLPGNEHVWHLYVVRVPDRDRVRTSLERSGIGLGIHYPTPIHLLPAFAELGLGPGDFPLAERLATEILSLPMFPGITEHQQVRVVQALRDAVR